MASTSSFVDISDDDIIKFFDEQENENTAKKAIYNIAMFKEFRAIYNSYEREIQGIPPEELQPVIKNFGFVYSKAKRQKRRAVFSQSICPKYWPLSKKKTGLSLFWATEYLTMFKTHLRIHHMIDVRKA